MIEKRYLDAIVDPKRWHAEEMLDGTTYFVFEAPDRQCPPPEVLIEEREQRAADGGVL